MTSDLSNDAYSSYSFIYLSLLFTWNRKGRCRKTVLLTECVCIMGQVISRTKSPAEIIAEYERLQREREERRLQQRTNPRVCILFVVVTLRLQGQI